MKKIEKKGINTAFSLVKRAKKKNKKQKIKSTIFLFSKYLIKKIKFAKVNIVNKESFLPGIQETALVNTGCVKKMKENENDIFFSIFNFFKKRKNNNDAIR